MIYDIKLFLWRIFYALYIMHYNKNLLEMNIKACSSPNTPKDIFLEKLGTIKSNLTIKQEMDTFLFPYCIFLIQKEIWLKLVIVPITYSLSYKNKNGKTFLSLSLSYSLSYAIKLTYYLQKLFLYNMANFFIVQNTSLFLYLTLLYFYL